MGAQGEGQDRCMACDLSAGALPLPGGRVYQSRLWVVEHCVGPLGVGTLVVKPFRHVVHIAELTEAESAELGPLLRRVAAAVEQVVRPEQVYVCLWSHAGGVPGHLHFIVQPATRHVMERFGAHGPALQVAMFDAEETPDEAAIDQVCGQLRTALNETGHNGGVFQEPAQYQNGLFVGSQRSSSLASTSRETLGM